MFLKQPRGSSSGRLGDAVLYYLFHASVKAVWSRSECFRYEKTDILFRNVDNQLPTNVPKLPRTAKTTRLSLRRVKKKEGNTAQTAAIQRQLHIPKRYSKKDSKKTRNACLLLLKSIFQEKVLIQVRNKFNYVKIQLSYGIIFYLF